MWNPYIPSEQAGETPIMGVSAPLKRPFHPLRVLKVAEYNQNRITKYIHKGITLKE